MTTRGKTTPASTAGSWAPHAGARSRVQTSEQPVTADTFDAVIAEHAADDAARWASMADQYGRTNTAAMYNSVDGDADAAENTFLQPSMHGHEDPGSADETIDSHIRDFGLSSATLTTRPLECDHVAILAYRMWDDVSTYGPGYNRGATEALSDARRAAQRGDRMAATLHLAAAQVAVGERTIDSRLRLETRLRLGLNVDAFRSLPNEQLCGLAAGLREREIEGGFNRDWHPTMRVWPEPDGRPGAAVSVERLLLETIMGERPNRR